MKLLLVGQVAQVRIGERKGRGRASGLIQRPLENRNRVQISRTPVCAAAG